MTSYIYEKAKITTHKEISHVQLSQVRKVRVKVMGINITRFKVKVLTHKILDGE